MAGIYSDCSTREIITTAKGSLAMYVGNRGNFDTAGGFCKCSGIFHNQISLSLALLREARAEGLKDTRGVRLPLE